MKNITAQRNRSLDHNQVKNLKVIILILVLMALILAGFTIPQTARPTF